jgi:hypothetical protein
LTWTWDQPAKGRWAQCRLAPIFLLREHFCASFLKAAEVIKQSPELTSHLVHHILWLPELNNRIALEVAANSLHWNAW